MSEWLSECDDVMEATTAWAGPGNWGKGGSEEILTLVLEKETCVLVKVSMSPF